MQDDQDLLRPRRFGGNDDKVQASPHVGRIRCFLKKFKGGLVQNTEDVL